MAKKYYKKEDNSWFYECGENETLVSPSPEKGECVEITKAQYDALVEIKELKAQLVATDYQAIKFAEGWISAEDYAAVKAQRQALRDQINELESTLE